MSKQVVENQEEKMEELDEETVKMVVKACTHVYMMLNMCIYACSMCMC